MAEGDEQKKFEITLYISIACGLASFTIFCLIYRRSLFYWYLRPLSPQTTETAHLKRCIVAVWLHRWYAPTKKPVNNPLLLSFWKSLVAWIPQAFMYVISPLAIFLALSAPLRSLHPSSSFFLWCNCCWPTAVSLPVVARDCCSYSDKRIWKEKGADAIMHIRFLRICLLLCGMMALFGSAVIIPINIHGTSLLSHDTHE
jgi:hypothetical protein